MLGCLCRDSSHPNPACLMHGSKGERSSRARTPAGQLRRKATTKLERKSGLDESSLKGLFQKSVRAAIKRERLRAMIESEGHAWCERCEKDLGSTVATAEKRCDLHHHDVRRDEGPGYDYRSGRFGADDPEGLLLACRGRGGCHDQLEKEAGQR